MKRIISLILFISLAATINQAQSARPTGDAKVPAAAKTNGSAPTVDQILDKYVSAVGGRDALEKINSRTTKGSLQFEKGLNLTGETEGYFKFPNKNLINTNLPGLGLLQEGYDGSTAWTKDSSNGLRERKGREFEEAKLDAEFNRELKLKRLYPKMELKGTQKIAGRDAYLIEATPAGGTAEKFYFDTQTGLLVRLDRERLTPQGDAVSVEIYYEDYREADGIKVHFSERHILPDVIVLIRYSSIKHNLPIDDAKFAKPSR
jgi:hypothetical protein